MRVILDHLQYKSGRSPSFEVEEKLWSRIEKYLVKNKIRFCWNEILEEEEYIDMSAGLIIWLPFISLNGSNKDAQILVVSNFADFLFEKMKLKRSCLHFVFEQVAVNGDGRIEEMWEELDEIVYEELTGEKLPPNANVSAILKKRTSG